MKGGRIMDKTLFKEYEKWCVKNKKDPLNEETVKEFKLFKEHQKALELANSQDEQRKVREQKQEEIFKMICEYAGVKTKYVPSYMFEALDRIFKSVSLASVMCKKEEEVSKVLEKVLG
jgi:hypothetical protein